MDYTDQNQLTVTTFSDLKIVDDDSDVGQQLTDPDDPKTLEVFTRFRKTSFHPRDRFHLANRRVRRRMVFKNGDVNLSLSNVRKRRRRYLADIFTTLVDMQWRYTLMIFVTGFIFSWVIFALLWYLICWAHTDFETEHLPGGVAFDNWKPCVNAVFNFTTALLFSIETQHTIGYGSRHITDACPEAVVVLMMQSCVGVIIQALMVGVVFAKVSRPKKRAETLMFSKKAVICLRDGKFCLMFRVGDMRKSHIVEAHCRAVLVKRKQTMEGEVDPLSHYELDLGYDHGGDRVFLIYPIILVHEIDEESPFWDISKESLLEERFELVVILEGTVESTGMITQARSSYLPSEILWGHRFKRLVTYQKDNGAYEIDYSRFHETVAVDMPSTTPKNFKQRQMKKLSNGSIEHHSTYCRSPSNHLEALFTFGDVPSEPALPLRDVTPQSPTSKRKRAGSSEHPNSAPPTAYRNNALFRRNQHNKNQSGSLRTLENIIEDSDAASGNVPSPLMNRRSESNPDFARLDMASDPNAPDTTAASDTKEMTTSFDDLNIDSINEKVVPETVDAPPEKPEGRVVPENIASKFKVAPTKRRSGSPHLLAKKEGKKKNKPTTAENDRKSDKKPDSCNGFNGTVKANGAPKNTTSTEGDDSLQRPLLNRGEDFVTHDNPLLTGASEELPPSRLTNQRSSAGGGLYPPASRHRLSQGSSDSNECIV